MHGVKMIGTCLWFDGQAEEAARFYTGIFKGSEIRRVSHYTEAGKETHQRPPGSVMIVAFDLCGRPFTALNGGPQFKFNEAMSLEVHCESQDEIDYLWEKLTAGGDPKAQVCGWLKDRFGVSWQIIPAELPALVGDRDPAKAGRAMTAMMKMKKIDLAALKRAHAGQG
jgi:predicted 3-demethylubiquinone-9 3-methyltransferase (glyoxalase superfamily)